MNYLKSVFSYRQGTHFYQCCVAFVLSVFAVFSFSLNNVIIAVLFYTLYMTVGFSVCLHRFYTHRTFTTSKFWELFMLLISVVSLSGFPLYFMHIHLRHHKHSDTDNDPHIPMLQGNFSVTPEDHDIDRKTIVEWFKKPYQRAIYDWHFAIITLYLLGLYLISFEMLVWAWAVPVAALAFARKQLLVRAAHVFGYSTHDTGDRSKNSKLLALITGGECLHNNHHNTPLRWHFSDNWREHPFDLGAWFIYLVRDNDSDKT